MELQDIASQINFHHEQAMKSADDTCDTSHKHSEWCLANAKKWC